jgi:hypothetical protein
MRVLPHMKCSIIVLKMSQNFTEFYERIYIDKYTQFLKLYKFLLNFKDIIVLYVGPPTFP